MNYITQGLILSLLVLAGCASTEVKREVNKSPSFNDAQLKSLLVGKTMKGSKDGTVWTTTVKPDGTTNGTYGTKTDKGTYTINNNLYCRDWENWGTGVTCWSMRKRTNDYYGTKVSGGSSSFSFKVQ